jgi:hypothetical protein
MNPADFFMLELSQYKESQGHSTKMNAESWDQYQKSSKKETDKFPA